MKNFNFRFLTLLMSVLLLFSSCQTEEKAPKKKDETVLNEETSEESAKDTEEKWENVETFSTFLITTKEELDAVRNDLGGNYRLENDIVFEKSDFEKGGAFYNEGRGWEAIGDDDHPFTGHFDGNGHTIQNLYVNIKDKGESMSVYAALFGRSDGLIEDLLMLDCNISGEYDSGSARCGVYAAAVAGNSIGVIKNCSVSGKISARVSSSNEKVFGFAGGICGSGNQVIGCRNEADVSTHITLSVDKQTAIASEAENRPYVTFCYAGGISGNVDMAQRCINTGEIRSESRALNPIGLVYDASYAGGIAADINSSTVTECHNYGKVEARALGGFAIAGGIVGNASGGEVSRSSNKGSVSSVTEAGRYDKGARSGGICAWGELKIFDCYNCGSVNAKTTSDPENTYDLAGLTYACGICVGNAYELKNCYNVGEINAESDFDCIYAAALIVEDISEEATGLYYLDTFPSGASREDRTIKCSDAEMKQKETYVGYDFETVWEIDPTTEYPYPTLR